MLHKVTAARAIFSNPTVCAALSVNNGQSPLWNGRRGLIWLVFVCWAVLPLLLVTPVLAQTAEDFQIDVIVANYSEKQRKSAYWLALNKVLRERVEGQLALNSDERESLLENPGLYVESFRYRPYDATVDSARLATRSVREGSAAGAVITVLFPRDLAVLIEQQLVPSFVEEEAVPTAQPVIALVAVDQQGSQFVIGGERAKKFQSRAIQLAAANNLQMAFPELGAEGAPVILPADILEGDAAMVQNIINRNQYGRVLTGALFSISSNTWQSDWQYFDNSAAGGADPTVSVRAIEPLSFSLTTRTLDEALVEAMAQISPTGGYLSSGYADGDQFIGGPQGVALRVENINSLEVYENVLTSLQSIDPDLVTDSLEAGAIVFRASAQGADRLRSSLTASRQFNVMSVDQYTGEMIFRYLGQ